MFCIRLFAFFLLGGFAFSARGAIITNTWVPIYKGIEFTRAEADTNEVRQQKVFALRVDLTDPDVEMFSTPAGGPLETIGQTTTTFVNTYDVAVGVNANFFSPVSTTPDDPRNLSGLAISEGNLVSDTESGRPVLLVTRSNLASIAQTAPSNLSNIWTAVAGSNRILIDGVPQLAECDTSFCNDNPRSAVGISSNGHYLYIMVIDGRRAGWSDGATLFETGEWLKRLGAFQGLNLDGGGSSALAKMEDGAAVLLNRPSGGVQRVNGNHLGVFAPSIAPVILSQPASQTVNRSSNATFSVSAGGTTSLHYQWRFNGTNISSATNTTLTLNGVQTSAAGDYSVAISNLVGVTVSSNAVLTVEVPLQIENVKIVPRMSSALIQWTSNPETVSKIEYGIFPNFENVLPLEPSVRTAHQFLLEGLVPRTNYQFRIISRIEENEVASEKYFFFTDPTLIVDNPQTTFTGIWTVATTATNKFGMYYQYTGTASGSSSAEAKYRPALLTPGKYNVEIWYPNGPNRSSNAQVTVVGNNTFNITKGINQQINSGSWQPVVPGVFCDPAKENFAVLANHTGEASAVVVADAMRWSYVATQDIPSDGSVPNWWSQFHFGTNHFDGNIDSDGDGYSAHSEYVMGTNPLDANSSLRLNSDRFENGLKLTFTPWQDGRIYHVLSSTNLSFWTMLPIPPIATNGSGIFNVTNSGQAGSQFYRISVQLAQ